MFCIYCGCRNAKDAKFCSNCGQPTAVPRSTVHTSPPIKTIHEQLSSRERISAIIWAVIAVLQLLLWISGEEFFMGVIGCVNAYGAYSAYKDSQRVLIPYAGLVEECRDNQFAIIITLVYNIIVGAGFFGVMGAIYEWNIRRFVLKNAVYIRQECDEFLRGKPL